MNASLVFNVPNQAHSTTLFAETGRVFGDFSSVPDTVEIDFEDLKFCRPSAVVFLSNLTSYLIRRGTNVTWRGMSIEREAIKFLDDSLFFKHHLRKPLNVRAFPRSTTQRLVEVRHAESHSWIGLTLVPWLASCSGLPEEAFQEFRTCVSELFNNIKDHTDYDVGSTFAQWYPRENELQIAIADFGIGIPASVRTVESHHDDNSAIDRAFIEGFSSQSTPQNRGVGLAFLRQNVLENLGGSLRVSSGKGSIRYTKSGNSLRKQLYPHSGYCPGTMIELTIRTDLIALDDLGEVEFEW